MTERERIFSYKAGVAILILLAVIIMTGFSGGRRLSPAPVFIEDLAPITAPSFPLVEVEAKSAYVYDMTDGTALYDKNAELQLPLASLTKVMSAYTASTLLPEYMLIRISPSDIREQGDSGLKVDEEWNVQKLTDFSLITSSNDGIAAIASTAGAQIAANVDRSPERLFTDRMNTLAREIGLTQTYYLNQSGLDVSATLAGGYGSARDTVLLFQKILLEKPRLLEATSLVRMNVESKAVLHDAENTNKALSTIPRVLASKTGYTDLSGGNLIVAFDAGVGHPIIISVLGSSYDGRFSDMEKLVSATLEYLSQKTAQ
jgi:D-alanyl-D-alanine carboxypeptidase